MTERTLRRFGVMLYPDVPIEVLIERIVWLESLGFDQVFLPDHSANLRNRRELWFDSWAVLAAGALNTSRIRLGVMVANQILRPPAQLAKQAVTLDHMSNGRFELGIGAGIFAWDHLSVGELPWSPRERALRFSDYVAIVDGLLHEGAEPFSYTGDRRWVEDVMAVPGPRQSPRLPIIVGGQSPTVLRVAAERADVWNTHGRPGASADEVLTTTAARSHRIDELAVAAGRDPSSIRRSYTLFGPWDPRAGRHTYQDVFDNFGAIGISEYVLDWPDDEDLDVFEAAAREVLPGWRQGA
jgi:alkanesulfonate monooxygenase SsuD/methylene tetrahydromethanopterin reductase-like flavin-dependent oxidoreductase (luciferase family)